MEPEHPPRLHITITVSVNRRLGWLLVIGSLQVPALLIQVFGLVLR